MDWRPGHMVATEDGKEPLVIYSDKENKDGAVTSGRTTRCCLRRAVHLLGRGVFLRGRIAVLLRSGLEDDRRHVQTPRSICASSSGMK